MWNSSSPTSSACSGGASQIVQHKTSLRWRSRNGAPRPRPPASRRSSEPQHDEFRIVVAAALDRRETLRRGERRFFRLLDDDQRVGLEPSAGTRRGQRFFGNTLAVGRIEKGERERLDRMRRAELGGVAAKDAGHSAASSTNSVNAAPRDSASMPSAPVPANRSSTRAPLIGSP